jgi:hypothetical protein
MSARIDAADSFWIRRFFLSDEKNGISALGHLSLGVAGQLAGVGE